jgi:4'-phosphopantetheinyl transferase
MTAASLLLPTRGAQVTVLLIPERTPAADLALLSADEQQRAARFAFERDRCAFVTARAAVRREIGAVLGLAPARVSLLRDANGRPHLAPEYGSTLDFNLSHSGQRVAIAFASGRRVGVDIEWHDRKATLRDLVPQVMGAREAALLQALPDAEFRRRFFEFWTRKESIVKAIGVGISYPLTEIDIPTLPVQGPVRIATDPPSAWMLHTSAPDDEYTLSVALAGSDGDIVTSCADRCA